MPRRSRLTSGERGSALVEFAISVPLLVVFVVGIYDFSGAFNQKQKIEHAAQAGAIIAGSQPTSDMDVGNPDSLQAVATTVFKSLESDGVVRGCTPPGSATGPTGTTWTYTITGCPNDLVITVNRGRVVAGSLATVSTAVTVSYPYQWRFNSVIQLLFSGSSSFAAMTDIHETAIVHNQL